MIQSIKSFLSYPLLMSVLWVCAFVCALYPINDLELWLFFSSCALMLLWSYFTLSKTITDGWKLPKSPVLYLAGAFWFLAAVSVFGSEVKPISFMGFCLFSVMPLTFFCAVIGGHDEFFKRCAKSLAVVFGVLSIWAIIQYLFLNEYFYWQARHPLADPSSLGALLSLGFFCSLGWILGAKTKTQKYLAGILSSLLLCGIISTVARGPVLAFIPAIVLFVWLLWAQVKHQKIILIVVTLIGLLYYGIGAYANKNMDIGQRIVSTATQGLEKEHARFSIWNSGFEILKDYPVLGTGIGTFFLYFPEHREKTFEETIYFAHNDPLQFAIEMGLLSPLLFYAFILFAAIRTFKSLSVLKTQKNDHDKIIIVSIFCALVALVIGSHVGFNHYNLSILLLEGLLLAVWFLVTSRVLNEKIQAKPMPKSLPTWMCKSLLASPFLIAGFLLFGILAGEHYANRASKDLFQENMLSFGENINKAGNISHDQNYRAYLLAVSVPLAILEFKGDKIEEDEAQKLYNQVTSYMNKVLEINPRSATAYYYLGKVQTMVPQSVTPKDTLNSEDYYKKSLKIDPTHLGSRLALNLFYESMNKPIAERLAFMEEGVNFTYHTGIAIEYYDQMAKLYLESGDFVKTKGALLKKYNFENRAKHSRIRENSSIPRALMAGDELYGD